MSGINSVGNNSPVQKIVATPIQKQVSVDAPRQHHQWFPDELALEGKDAELVKKLTDLGHKMRGHRQGDAHSIWIDPKTGIYHGAADRRINGKAAGY